MIPEMNEAQNVQRAAILSSSCQSEVLTEVIKIIIFLISNRLLDVGLYRSNLDGEMFIALCRLTGLAQPTNIRRLTELSKRSLTLAAVVDALFQTAVSSSALDIVSTFLSANYNIGTNKPLSQSMESYLFYAVRIGSYDLAAVLLRAGADIHNNTELLCTAILITPPTPSSHKLVSLLIEHGIGMQVDDNPTELSPLHAAINMGRRDLIEVFIEAGFHLNCRLIYTHKVDYFSHWHIYSRLKSVGCLGFAAAFDSAYAGVADRRGPSFLPPHKDSDQDSLDLCRFIISKYRSQMDLSPHKITDAMILAATHGYTKVMSYLRKDLSAPVMSWNGTISPLYAAVENNCLDAFQLLMEMGATMQSPRFVKDKPWRTDASIPVPSLLHVAVNSNAVDILERLVQRIDNINQPSAFLCVDEEYLIWEAHDFVQTIRESAFRLAMRQSNLDIAFLLLNHGAIAKTCDLLAAAECGHLHLMRELVRKGVEPSKSDFALMFRHFEVPKLESIIPPQLLATPGRLTPDRDCRSYLENAILSSNKDVIDFAFSLNTTYYDSGSLCAAVLLSSRGVLQNAGIIVEELLRRRHRAVGESGYNPPLENTALSMATVTQSFPLFSMLIRHLRPDMINQPAVFPAPLKWLGGSSLDIVLSCYLNAKDSSQQNDTGQNSERIKIPVEFNQWHISSQLKVRPLLFASLWRNEEAVHSLLAHGYKSDGFTLRIAIQQKLSSKSLGKLIINCEDINDECADEAVRSLPTPLCIVVHQGRRDIVDCLLDHNADINRITTNRYGLQTKSTALKEAVSTKSLELVSLLLNRGAKVEEPMWSLHYPYTATALQIAAKDGHIGILKTLLAKGANVNARRSLSGGSTALEAAASYGRLDTVQLLLDCGVETEGFGRVQYVKAVFLASVNGHTAVGDLLKTYREWTSEDEQVRDEVRECWAINAHCWLHKNEFSTLQFIQLVTGLQVEWLWDGRNSLVQRSRGIRVRRFSKWSKLPRKALEKAHAWLITHKLSYPTTTEEKLNEAATVAWQGLQKLAQGHAVQHRFTHDSYYDSEDGSRAYQFSSNSSDDLEANENVNEDEDEGDEKDEKDDEDDEDDEGHEIQHARNFVLNALEEWKVGCSTAPSDRRSRESTVSEWAMNISMEDWLHDTNPMLPNDGTEIDSENISPNCRQMVVEDTCQSWPRIHRPMTEQNGEVWDDQHELVLNGILGEAEAPCRAMEF
jgi:ankyrin repeat protein